MKKFILFVFAIHLSLVALAISNEEPKLDWVACYKGPGSNDGYPQAMVVDDSGNVYITGASEGPAWEMMARGAKYRDYATIKYDSNGKELWVARYDGSAHSVDEATAIVVDNSGNVYVTGKTVVKGRPDTWKDSDVATIKYNSTGKQLWIVQQGPDIGVDLTIPDKNHIQVLTANGDKILYDYDGNKINEVKLGFFVSATDHAGNFYCRPDNGSLIKCDGGGKKLWETTDASWVYDIAFDASDNVITLGILKEGIALLQKLQKCIYLDVTKYNMNGKKIWSQRPFSPEQKEIYSRYIRTDEKGNAYLFGDTVEFLAVVKYSCDGQKLWEVNIPSFIIGPVFVSKEGNVYISGSDPDLDDDLTIYKYDSQGKLVWSVSYDGKFGTPRAMTLDKQGNI